MVCKHAIGRHNSGGQIESSNVETSHLPGPGRDLEQNVQLDKAAQLANQMYSRLKESRMRVEGDPHWTDATSSAID